MYKPVVIKQVHCSGQKSAFLIFTNFLRCTKWDKIKYSFNPDFGDRQYAKNLQNL